MTSNQENRLGKRFCWTNFLQLVQQEFKVFIFLLALFCVFRAAFIGIMHAYMGANVVWQDIITANYYGLKLSLKSAGILAGVSIAGSLVLYGAKPRLIAGWRYSFGSLVIFILTFLFCARIPYYEQFHSGFNQLIFNTLNDDVSALLWSLVKQYYLPLRLLGVAVLGWLIMKLFKKWLSLSWNSGYREPLGKMKYLVRIGLFVVLYFFGTFVSFGGSMSFAGNVDWENSGVTRDKLLNEAILDDMQALYRAYEMNGRMESSTGLMYTAEDVQAYAKYLSGKTESSQDLAFYLAKQPNGQGKPHQQVFLILSESYANWPLLEKYEQLHIADGMKKIIAAPDSDYVDTFLPNGMSTISAVMGVVTGLADANLYLTTMPEAYSTPYITSLAPQLGRLGYKTNFWYAGPSSWEKVKEFSLAQGFDNFYGRGDYPAEESNVWGCDDEYLYAAVMQGVDSKAKTFNLVLNVSNHSPYTVDLAKAGFPAEQVRAALPPGERNNEELLKQLGHYWYADKQLAEFVAAAKKKYPDSLFIIVGDHADRMNIDKTPAMYERYGIPLVVCGKGITKASLAQNTAGSQIDLMPTLMDLIAPRDFTYYSVGSSLTAENHIGLNYGFWLTPSYIGRTDTEQLEGELINGKQGGYNSDLINLQVNAVRCLSWYIGKKGSIIENK